jgi:hypothetical protein
MGARVPLLALLTLTEPVQLFAREYSVLLTYATTFILDK